MINALKSRILISFFTVIMVLGILIAALGFYVIKNDIIQRAQNQVKDDLNVARLVYNNELEMMKKEFSVVRNINDPTGLKERIALDYLNIVNITQKAAVRSEIARQAFNGAGIGGARRIEKEELKEMGGDIYRRSRVDIKFTPQAEPTDKKILESALAIEYARPLKDASGAVNGVIYGGRIINRDSALVDKIRDNVFGKDFLNSKPIGTVTLFLDDTRITTNVLDKEGKRAVGTRVSQKVYENVVEKGRMWVDRAFVVTDWYLTAYEPIRNIEGSIIGILYVGILEKPFNDMRRNVFFVFTVIILIGIILSAVLSFILNQTITKPFDGIIEGAKRLSSGELQYRVQAKTGIKELNHLADSFNRMAIKLQERDTALKAINDKLMVLNKSYLDMIGFVSHELKGILGSVIMNVYSVKDRFLGPLNDKQQKALDSTAGSLDHFENMVKNYLDLSRIERGELEVKVTDTDLNENIVVPAIAHFEKQMLEKGIVFENRIPPGIRIKADRELLLIVCDNLIGNAVKYNVKGGSIIIEQTCGLRDINVRVYNDGAPIGSSEADLLFKRFSRLPCSENIRGSGIGLFIAKEIIEKHGGRIWVEPQVNGNTFVFAIGQGG